MGELVMCNYQLRPGGVTVAVAYSHCLPEPNRNRPIEGGGEREDRGRKNNLFPKHLLCSRVIYKFWDFLFSEQLATDGNCVGFLCSSSQTLRYI